MAEFLGQYGYLGDDIRKDFIKCIQVFTSKLLNEMESKPIDELAEMAQKYYNWYNGRTNSHAVYAEVDPEVKTELEALFEKHSMVTLYT